MDRSEEEGKKLVVTFMIALLSTFSVNYFPLLMFCGVQR